jgi:hypothetical protein
MDLRAFSGLRNDRPVERFDPSDLSVAQNIDIDNSGAIAMRSGYVLRSAGAKHSLWSSDDEAIALYVSGTALYRLNADTSGTVLMTGLTAGLPMAYWKTLDRVYFTNGQQSGVLDNGIVRSWGLAVPPAPAVSQTSGAMPAGSYQYTLTYFRNDGQESGAALASRIDIAATGAYQPYSVSQTYSSSGGSAAATYTATPEQVTNNSGVGGLSFTLPVSSDPTVVSKGIYISTPNSEVLYLAMVVPNATTSATYSGSTAEFNLPLITQFLAPPPAGQIVRDYRGVMYVASGDAIYPSEDYGYELFDYRKAIPFDGRVTLLEALDNPGGGGLFVGTDRACGALVGRGIADFEYVPKVNYGAVEGTSVRVDGSLFGDDSAGARLLPVWLTTHGIMVGLPQMEVRNLTRTRYRIAASGRGAGVFQPTSNRLILTAAL